MNDNNIENDIEIVDELTTNLNFGNMSDIDKKIAELSRSNDLPGFFQINKSDFQESENTAELSNSINDPDNKIKSVITQHLGHYKEKYGIEMTYDTIESYLQFSQLANKDDKRIKDLITSELISVLSSHIVTKLIIVVSKVVDNILDNIQRKVYNDDISEMTLTTVEKLFEWVAKFESIKTKYKIYDLETSLNRIKANVDNSTKEDESTVQIINIIKDSLKKSEE